MAGSAARALHRPEGISARGAIRLPAAAQGRAILLGRREGLAPGRLALPRRTGQRGIFASRVSLAGGALSLQCQEDAVMREPILGGGSRNASSMRGGGRMFFL